MQKTIYEAPDIYWELFCGEGDVIEARFENVCVIFLFP